MESPDLSKAKGHQDGLHLSEGTQPAQSALWKENFSCPELSETIQPAKILATLQVGGTRIA